MSETPAPAGLVELVGDYTDQEPDVIVELVGGTVTRVRAVRGLCVEVREAPWEATRYTDPMPPPQAGELEGGRLDA